MCLLRRKVEGRECGAGTGVGKEDEGSYGAAEICFSPLDTR